MSKNESLYWEKCPKCGAIGRIDQEQRTGQVSIICPECGNHYYREKEK